MTLLLSILNFLWHIASGGAWNAWKEHTQKEADNAKNKAESLNDSDAVSELRDKWTRK